MDFNTAKEEEFGFSGNYFLANEMGSSGKKSARKLSDINVVDEQSLTPNGQSVFRILAEYQLSHPNDEGMAIDNLYSIPRERFLVSSQQHELPCKDGLRPSKNRKGKTSDGELKFQQRVTEAHRSHKNFRGLRLVLRWRFIYL
uniref:Uncharacterized protein n=1 Tax=Gossypium raimondii TaxID=29730 RepID=A0A0D2REE0_GOSRA|nr:hypothetical protein B456_011G153000 [Gossypium raimondii]